MSRIPAPPLAWKLLLKAHTPQDILVCITLDGTLEGASWST